MKIGKIKIGDLFSKLNLLNIEYEHAHKNLDDIFIRTPFGDFSKILAFVRKNALAVRVKTESNKTLVAASNHIVITKNGEQYLKDANEILIVDEIEKVFDNIVSKEFVGNRDLYDISIREPHLYVDTNGFVHHNSSLSKALCNDVGCEYLFINGSDENGIDTFRNKIKNYASSVSLNGKRKVIIIDEADYLNCFTEDTLVEIGTLQSSEKIPLKDLDLYDYPIVSFNTEYMRFENDTGRIITDTEKEVFEVTFDIGEPVQVTADHPFICYSDENCYEVSINSGLKNEKVILRNYDLAKVLSIKPIGVRRVLNLEVDKNHTFVVGSGFVVHNCNSIQPALRSAMEEFSKNTSFIFTCNYPNKIIAPIHSRCSVVDFTLKNSEKAKIAKEFFNRIKYILNTEGIDFDEKVVAEVIKRHFPDFRRVINELQKYSKFGAIDSGILGQLEGTSVEKVIEFMRNKDFKSIRSWAASGDYDSSVIFKHLYDGLNNFLEPASIPQAVLIIADYDYKANFVSNPEINLVACLTNLMVDLDFKS